MELTGDTGGIGIFWAEIASEARATLAFQSIIKGYFSGAEWTCIVLWAHFDRYSFGYKVNPIFKEAALEFGHNGNVRQSQSLVKSEANTEELDHNVLGLLIKNFRYV